MTEAEWLKCGELSQLFDSLGRLASARKTRLFGCAAVGWCWSWGLEEPTPEAVRIAEAYADRSTTAKQLRHASAEMQQLRSDIEEHWRPFPRMCELTALLCSTTEYRLLPDELDAYASDMHIQEVPEWLKISDFARDIFGNPFRPVTFAPAWRTTDVTLLARGIYDDRAFDRMPILADALQDAGCEDEQILGHCRDRGQVHVRGCWVVDLVLGKE